LIVSPFSVEMLGDKLKDRASDPRANNEAFFSVLSSCKRKIIHLSLQQQMKEKDIKYYQSNDGAISFHIPCEPLNVQNIVVTTSEHVWQAKVIETSPLPSHMRPLTSGVDSLEQISYCYDGTHNYWQFSYSTSRDTFHHFLGDLNAVSHLAEYREQLDKLQERHHIPEIVYSATSLHFAVQVGRELIAMDLDWLPEQSKFSIRLKMGTKETTSTVSPHLIELMESYLNERKHAFTSLQVLLSSAVTLSSRK